MRQQAIVDRVLLDLSRLRIHIVLILSGIDVNLLLPGFVDFVLLILKLVKKIIPAEDGLRRDGSFQAQSVRFWTVHAWQFLD